MQNLYLKHDTKITRALEIVPGVFSWSLILFPFWGSFIIPHYVAYVVILFIIYWAYKSGTLAISALFAYFKIKAAQKYDWMSDVKKLPNWKKVYHIVVIPNYKEKPEKLGETLNYLVDQDLPTRQIVPVLAMEEREPGAKEKAEALTQEFGKKFKYFYYTLHPDLPGEVKGKSSNEAWAGKWAKKKLVDELGLDMDFLTISSCDADSLFHPKYFSCLTFKFLTDKNRYHRFWEAAILYYSNIWRVPIPIRVVNTFGSVWRMGILVRKDRLINMSTYSLSLKMLDKVGYWDVDVIPEDYRIFFKSYFKLEGKVTVEPIFLPILVDAAESTTYWKTLVNQYEQMKRWAWGVSDDPLFIKWWATSKNVPFWDKTLHILKILEDHFLWPVNWFLITLGATIPTLFNPVFAKTVLGYNLPRVSFFILTFCLIFLVITLAIDMKQRPPRPKNISPFRQAISPLEFFLMPVVGFFLSALPGLDAHTRLMLGKYMEYKVTEKV